jgi:hypothetical protein
MTGLALQVDDRPVFLPLLDMTEVQIDRFVPPKSAGEQDCQECALLRLFRVSQLPSRTPIFFDSFDASYASSEIRA